MRVVQSRTCLKGEKFSLFIARVGLCLFKTKWLKKEKKKKNSWQRYLLDTLPAGALYHDDATTRFRFRAAFRYLVPDKAVREGKVGPYTALYHMRPIPFVVAPQFHLYWPTEIQPYMIYIYIWKCNHCAFHVVRRLGFEHAHVLNWYNDRSLTRIQRPVVFEVLMDSFYLISFLQFLLPFSRKRLLLRWIRVDIVKEMPLYTMVKNYSYVYPVATGNSANCMRKAV